MARTRYYIYRFGIKGTARFYIGVTNRNPFWRKFTHVNNFLKFLYKKDYKCVMSKAFQEAAKEKQLFNKKKGKSKVTSGDFTMRVLASATSPNKASIIESEFINLHLLNDRCMNAQPKSHYLKQTNGRLYGKDSR